MDEKNYAIVGGMSAQIHSHIKNSSIKKRSTDDIDISNYPNTSFKEFQSTYGDQIARFMKNKFRYGFHLENNRFANTVNIFDKRNKNKEFALLHFNRYQEELYEKIKDKLIKDITENSTDIDISKLGIDEEGSIKVLNVGRIMDFKKDRINKKLRAGLERVMNFDYGFKVVEDIENNNNLSYIDLDKLYEETTNNSREEDYGNKKDVYDYAVLSKISQG